MIDDFNPEIEKDEKLSIKVNEFKIQNYKIV